MGATLNGLLAETLFSPSRKEHEMAKKRTALALLALVVLLAVPALQGQGQIPPPKFGQYTSGDDYFLANYTQLLEYWAALAKASDRMKVVEIGKTTEGRPIMMAIITSPENHKKLGRYKEIRTASRWPRASPRTRRGRWPPRARRSCGSTADCTRPRSTGVAAPGAVAYQMVSQNDPETMRILNDVILLLVPINPDGMELVVELVHARSRTSSSGTTPAAEALQQVRRARRQPRLLCEQPARDDSHQPADVHRVVSRRSCTTSTRRVRPASWCSCRRSAIRSTTTSIR